mmetsp:Transcript_4646/g.16516  ORF Transcript_4646/g.16516 Transcript_4646/m.16516 type:complete len:383 (+) Transcript_4646:1659-2807(+)
MIFSAVPAVPPAAAAAAADAAAADAASAVNSPTAAAAAAVGGVASAAAAVVARKEKLSKLGLVRAVILRESIRVEEQPGELPREVVVHPVRVRPDLVLDLLRELTVVVRLVAYHAKQVPQRASVVTPVLAEVVEQPGGEPRRPLLPPQRAAPRPSLQLREQQVPALLPVLHLHAVGDVVQKPKPRLATPPHRVEQHLGRRRPRRRVRANQARHEVSRLGEVVERAEVVVASKHARVSLVPLPERVPAAGEAKVEEAPQRKRVHRARLPAVEQTLGRDPPGSAAAAAAAIVAGSVRAAAAIEPGLERRPLGQVQPLREPHVRELASKRCGHEHVLRLQVAMDDAARVQRVETRARVAHDPQPRAGRSLGLDVHKRRRHRAIRV